MCCVPGRALGGAQGLAGRRAGCLLPHSRCGAPFVPGCWAALAARCQAALAGGRVPRLSAAARARAPRCSRLHARHAPHHAGSGPAVTCATCSSSSDGCAFLSFTILRRATLILARLAKRPRRAAGRGGGDACGRRAGPGAVYCARPAPQATPSRASRAARRLAASPAGAAAACRSPRATPGRTSVAISSTRKRTEPGPTLGLGSRPASEGLPGSRSELPAWSCLLLCVCDRAWFVARLHYRLLVSTIRLQCSRYAHVLVDLPPAFYSRTEPRRQ